MALGKAIYRLVASRSGAGKTSLGTRLVERLSAKGVPVAVIKHAASHLDVPGKDTARYREAGARMIVASSPRETMIIYPRGMEDIDLLVPLLPPSIFVVLVEGFRRSKRGKKIIVAGTPADLEEIGCKPRDTLAVVSGDEGVLESARKAGCRALGQGDVDGLADAVYADAVETALSMLPGVDCGYCGFPTCRMYAEAVVRGEKTLAECPLSLGVTVVVDGSRVPLNPYVKNVFWSVARALVSTLKGVPSEPRTIEIRVDLEGRQG